MGLPSRAMELQSLPMVEAVVEAVVEAAAPVVAGVEECPAGTTGSTATPGAE